MQIELNNLTAGPESVKQNCRAVLPAAPDTLPTCEERLHLHEALNHAPDVRAEKMARARALVADPNYPSGEHMKQVARLLAANWENENSIMTPSPRFSNKTSAAHQGAGLTLKLRLTPGQRN